MADNPITTPLPADLPTNWVYGQTIGPQGTDVGLTQQHGYNYLMQQVNAAQQAATQIGQAFSGLPSLGSDGKIPASQLPEMNYDKAGSAAAVQANLNAHTGNKNNPHGVTASQIGAAAATDLTAHTGNRDNPHGVTAAQVGARANTWVPSWNEVTGKPGTFPPSGHNHDAANITSGIFPVARGGTGVNNLSALAAQIAANGGCRIASGSYAGTGSYGNASPTSIQFPFPAKYVGILTSKTSEGTLYVQDSYILVSSVPVNQYGPETAGNGPFGQRTAYQYNSNQNTLYWYSTQSAADQCNRSNTTYYWIALG